jgi:hypothetical protein
MRLSSGCWRTSTPFAAALRRRHSRSGLPVEADVIVRVAGARESLPRREEDVELLGGVCRWSTAR